MTKVLAAFSLFILSSAVYAQQSGSTPYYPKASQSCAWMVLQGLTKSTAAARQCEGNADANGFPAANPKRATWLSECRNLVNSKISACQEADGNCVKNSLPSFGEVCTMTKRIANQ
jgi:hypothetical protein